MFYYVKTKVESLFYYVKTKVESLFYYVKTKVESLFYYVKTKEIGVLDTKAKLDLFYCISTGHSLRSLIKSYIVRP